jgi:hypothetical protein
LAPRNFPAAEQHENFEIFIFQCRPKTGLCVGVEIFSRNFPAVNRCEKVCFRGLTGPENFGIFWKFWKFSKIFGNFPEIFPPKIRGKRPKYSREMSFLQSGKFPDFPEFPGGISGGFPGDFRGILDNFRHFLQPFYKSCTLDYSRKFVFLEGLTPQNFQLFAIFEKFSKNFQKFPKFFSAGTFFQKISKNFQKFPKFSKIFQKFPKFSKISKFFDKKWGIPQNFGEASRRNL